METFQFTLTGVQHRLDTFVLPEVALLCGYCLRYSYLACCGGAVNLKIVSIDGGGGYTPRTTIQLGQSDRHWYEREQAGQLVAAFNIIQLEFEERDNDAGNAGCVVDLKICLTMSDYSLGTSVCAGTIPAEYSYVDIL